MGGKAPACVAGPAGHAAPPITAAAGGDVRGGGKERGCMGGGLRTSRCSKLLTKAPRGGLGCSKSCTHHPGTWTIGTPSPSLPQPNPPPRLTKANSAPSPERSMGACRRASGEEPSVIDAPTSAAPA